ncbi:hypothetical protein [Dyadobacter psychrotolerans]|uniref:Uncharacterized protein n=1 Tax=Dyadobacter psychrotolerans TaxID=2541721 RepID=A0A4R5E1K6_9BACT|nr:hypothetical protein [Dyadobacter psychrotolerans]TDE17693.1 hypothetical protein E0F88_07330 [Dyadobacter psychrotolerans]
MTDFKEALDEFTDDARCCNECGGHDFNLSDNASETIRKALLICSRLQEEPSDLMFKSCENLDTEPGFGEVFKAMTQQLMKECE